MTAGGTPRISGVFELTQTGAVITKSHLQNFIAGPRISFPGTLKVKESHLARLWPFAEVQVRLFPSEFDP